MQIPIPTLSDVIVIVIAFLWIFGIIGFGEILRRWRNYSPAVTRKFIHLFAGFAIFTVPFYSYAWFGLLVSFPMLILIFLASPKSPVKSLRTIFEVMAREEDYLSGHIWGPFLYAISINVLVAIFILAPTLIPYFILPAIGLTAMYLGDGIAPIVGAKIGRHRYTIGNATRTVEGSIAIFLGAILGTFVCYVFFEWFVVIITPWAPVFNNLQIMILAITAGIVASLIEGVSPAGSDNITVPLITTLALFLVALFIHPTMLLAILGL